MAPSLHHLLLSALFSICAGQGSGSQTVFIINSIQLKILPGTKVESGTNVTLQCTADVSQGEGPPLAFQFSFYRDQNLVYSKNVTALHLSHLLVPARAAHSGQYHCSIKILNREKKANSKTLTVSGLQTPILNLKKQSVTEGEELTARCSAPNEFGNFCFNFYANSTEVHQQCSHNNSVQVQLMLEGGGLQYLHCNVHLLQFRQESNNSKTEIVSVRELNINPRIGVLPTSRLVEGDRLEIQCDVEQVPSSLSQKLQVFLNKGAMILHSGPKYASWKTEKALAEDSGNYTCKSETGSLQKTSSVTVNVAELFSKPVLTMDPPEVFEGQQFTLTCRSANISSERITETDVKYSIYKNNELLSVWINTAKPSDNGHYTCQAVAKTIRKNSSVIALKVKELVSSPLIMARGMVVLNKPFTILCRSKKGSFPINYTLLKRQRPVGVYTVHSSSDEAVFNVSIRSKEEIQEFSCDAQNSGHQSKKLGLALNGTVIEPISRPELETISDLEEGNDLKLKCSVEKGSLPITFTWYRDRVVLWTLHTKHREEVYTAKDITKASTYYCEAVNSANETMQSNPQTVRVMLAKWKKVLIGIFILLAIIAVIAGVFLCKAKRGKKSETELSVKAAKPKHESGSVTVSIRPGSGSYSKVDSDDTRKTVWSENTSDSNSEDQSSEDTTDKPDLEYTEHVQLELMETSGALPRKGTDVVYSEVQNSAEGAVDHTDAQGSVEYAQLNHANLEPGV
ncbi:platelet endothelial cell adhesion molecule isoform X1 [Scleropages formosus]|uniref:platelet endothelial cell adhesion molecule isoform X1 n=1 Tax=Scleropages formosus TaxID=113540 RepID=UPI0008786765|nr:platelet endothelial cell adhesion molecule-like isoform X1 [Scleropages formosus]